VIEEAQKVYVFRKAVDPTSKGTEITIARADAVVSCFGGNGIFNSNGLSALFDGCICYKDERTGDKYLGVWGVRKCAKFRNLMRKHFSSIEISREIPPFREIFSSTKNSKPSKKMRRNSTIKPEVYDN
jgi:hypothetical protein